MATSTRDDYPRISPLIWGALFLLATSIFFADVFNYVQTGIWSEVSLADLLAPLADNETASSDLNMSAVNRVFEAVPAFLFFFAAGLLFLLGSRRRA